MKRIDRLVQESITQTETLRGARAWMALRKWASIVGPTLAAKSIPDRYEKGTVWVAVIGSTWATELRMRKDDILHKLQEASGEPGLFQKIRFGVRPVVSAIVSRDPEPAHYEPPPNELSIREIGDRLIEKLRNEGRD